ncbi:uncharacterized protein LOC131300504 isoform X1 [Rhododendron vialii]|uniref:uncharacterized protein LOC131300504 isoform X1 n=1 Tax=Rhododendron vialii TaxID=182163 RepID=UPI00265D8931|nr:uncharacterized protein LOC131300504 isoform X1 [Rhododendron vialii]
MSSSNRFLFVNGVVSPSSPAPTVSAFLESRSGAYTTTRTHGDGSLVLFWDRHLRRLADSARVLLNANPSLLFGSPHSLDSFSPRRIRSPRWESAIESLVNESMSKALPVALGERKSGEELAITALVSGNLENICGFEDLDEERVSRVLDVRVHVGMYVPPEFGVRENGARLAVVGRGRDVANAKYSDWVRLRKSLEKLRPPLATELLLSNDGDQILEGAVTNFFVVCRKDNNGSSPDATGEDLHGSSTYPYEIQTAPIRDGVLPGVMRQVIIDLCSSNGIPVREVASSWSRNELWEEAFITNSLRILQHVESIQVPLSWKLLESEKDVTWVKKQFREAPGKITALIQREIMKTVGVEGYGVTSFKV